MGRGNDQAEVFKPREAVDHGRAGEAGPAHQLAEAHGHALVGDPPACLQHDQVDLDRLPFHASQIAAVDEHAPEPIGLDGHGDGHDQPPPWSHPHGESDRTPRPIGPAAATVRRRIAGMTLFIALYRSAPPTESSPTDGHDPEDRREA